LDRIIGKLTRLREVRRDVVLAQSVRQQAVVDAARNAFQRAESEVIQLRVQKRAYVQSLNERMHAEPRSTRDLASAGVDLRLQDHLIEEARGRIAPAAERLRVEESVLAEIRQLLRRADAKRDQAERAGGRLRQAARLRAEAGDEELSDDAALRNAGPAAGLNDVGMVDGEF
jgi:hypothetical protein